MNIAILGTRGAPANYGGFETLAEELGWRLAERGHRVTVYGRSGFVDPSLGSYRGMRLVVLPAIRSKHLETVSHTFLASIHAFWEAYDAVLLCNAANAPFVRILQLARTPVALNVAAANPHLSQLHSRQSERLDVGTIWLAIKTQEPRKCSRLHPRCLVISKIGFGGVPSRRQSASDLLPLALTERVK